MNHLRNIIIYCDVDIPINFYILIRRLSSLCMCVDHISLSCNVYNLKLLSSRGLACFHVYKLLYFFFISIISTKQQKRIVYNIIIPPKLGYNNY